MEKSLKKITQFVFTFVASLILALGIKGMEVSAEATVTSVTDPYKMELDYNSDENGARNTVPPLKATDSVSKVYIHITTRPVGDGWIKINADNAVVRDSLGSKTYSYWTEIPVKANATYIIQCPVTTAGGTISNLFINYHIHKYYQYPKRTSIGSNTEHKLEQKCSCGQWSNEREGHTWEKSAIVPPTCTQKGYTIYKCSYCADTKKDDPTDKIPHNYSVYSHLNSRQHEIKCSGCSDYTVEDHSFIQSGSNNTCSKCGYTYDASSVNSDGSDYDSVNNAAPPEKFYVTKFDSNKVNITIVPSSSNRLDRTVDYEIYANGKKIKTYSNYWGYDAIIYTYKSKGAAKKKYQVKVVQKENNSVAVSSVLKPKTNKPKNVKYSFTKRASVYSAMANTWRPSSIKIKGNKITVNGFFVNNHILKLSSIKCRVTVQYIDINSKRTSIKSKVLNSGYMRARSIKNTSFSFTTKKLMDFQNQGRLDVSYFITGWRY